VLSVRATPGAVAGSGGSRRRVRPRRLCCPSVQHREPSPGQAGAVAGSGLVVCVVRPCNGVGGLCVLAVAGRRAGGSLAFPERRRVMPCARWQRLRCPDRETSQRTSHSHHEQQRRGDFTAFEAEDRRWRDVDVVGKGAHAPTELPPTALDRTADGGQRCKRPGIGFSLPGRHATYPIRRRLPEAHQARGSNPRYSGPVRPVACTGNAGVGGRVESPESALTPGQMLHRRATRGGDGPRRDPHGPRGGLSRRP